MVCALAIFSLAAVATAQVPVSHWNFDGNLLDSAGTRNLTGVGAPPFSANAAPGQTGNSIDLTAGGNRATYDVTGADAVSGPYTISMWVNPTDGVGSTGTFFGTRGPTDTSFDVKFQGNTVLHGDIGTGGGWLDTSADVTAFNYLGGQWQHVAYVVQPGTYTAYVNGVPRATEALGVGTPLLFNSSHDIAVGAVQIAGGEEYSGLVDDVKIFNSALTAAQVRQAMAPAGTVPIPTLFSTGVDATGTALGNNVNDPHYSLVVDPSGLGDATVPVDGFPIPPWLANSSTSRWIGPADGNDANGPPGNYTYRTTFDLTGFDETTAMIAGLWATDNTGIDILINGTSVGAGQLATGFDVFTPFTIDTGFISGINTLDFVMANGAPTGPTALRVELSGFAAPAAVPEPASIALWTMLGLGLVGMGLRRVRRKR
jgi:hypothetical protein